MKQLTACILLFSVLSAHAVLVFGQTSKRPLTPDDLSRLEELAKPFAFTVAISPDGENIAFVVTRRASSSERFGFQLSDWNRQDIWMARAGDARAENITKGVTDDSGFWGPRWSPDGRYLAMLSTRGGNIRAWVWNKQSGRLEMLSERGVPWPVVQWLSNDELAFSVLPDGAKSSSLEKDRRIARLTSENWAKAWKGREPSASVLESGIESSIEGRIQEQLLVVNVPTRRGRVVATGLHFQDFQLSPDRRFLAYLKQVGVWRPDPNQIPETHFAHELYQLEIMRIKEDYAIKAMGGVVDVFSSRIGWSGDSSQLAVIGYSAVNHTEDAQIFRCVASEALCRPASNKLSVTGPYRANRVGSRGVVGRGFFWYGENNLLVYGSRQSAVSGPNQQQMKWWAVDRDGNPHEFFDRSIEAPTQLLAQSKGPGLVGIIRGDVWTVRSDGQLTRNLTSKVGGKTSSIVWPESWATSVQPAGSELVVGVPGQSSVELYSLDLDSGTVSPIEKPSADAELAAYDARTRLSVFVASNRTGSYLWLKTPEQKTYSPVLQVNTFLREVYEGEFRKIEYRGLDGQDLNAWIILPFGYQEGKRYPAVTWVYSGLVYGDKPPTAYAQFNESNPLTGQLLASHGYVVLYPSMPRQPLGEEADSYLEMTKGVLPAVDRLIDVGIAEPKRIGVIGQSYGGYNTYGLITQTNRFKAAVSLDGFCDLVSLYGAFDTRERYTPFPHEDLFRIVQAEADFGNPPWKDAGKYFRNSPINFVDRVQTPLLILHGDLDYVPIQQAEEFFMALYRQNKRARFVRYFGEDHIYQSPANVRDMWKQIFAWFDEHLKKPPN